METTESLQLSMTEALYPAIPVNHVYEESASFILPSEGEEKEWSHLDAECGKTKYIEKCDDKHHCDYPVDLIPWDCERYECPVCYKTALKQGAVGIREHVWNTLLEMKKAFPQTKWFVSSVIISAPKEINDLDYEKQHLALRNALKQLGTQNVAAIYHRWRYHNKATGEEMESIPWKEYQEHPELYERVLSVHWHCFVIGRMVKSSEYFDKTGWVYKKMKTDSGSWSIGLKDIYQIAYYALSHHAVSTTRRRHAVHYYGMFWRLTVVSKRYTKEPKMCPKGGHQRVRKTMWHNWDTGVDSYGLEEPAEKIIMHRKYKLRGIDYGDLDCGLDFSGVYAPVKEIDYVDL